MSTKIRAKLESGSAACWERTNGYNFLPAAVSTTSLAIRTSYGPQRAITTFLYTAQILFTLLVESSIDLWYCTRREVLLMPDVTI
ncbi:hypothetical protein F5X98DRAFT_376852 [Xylaria grammica]|nr:hypothetical protein F5X98DRAFT_376852 [Xylaria grammica]